MEYKPSFILRPAADSDMVTQGARPPAAIYGFNLLVLECSVSAPERVKLQVTFDNKETEYFSELLWATVPNKWCNTNMTKHNAYMVLNIRTSCHAWDLWKLAWSYRQLYLLFLSDRGNLPDTALLSGFQSSQGAPMEYWNPLSKTVPRKCSFTWNK